MFSSSTEPHPMHTASPRAWSISISLPPQFEQTCDILEILFLSLLTTKLITENKHCTGDFTSSHSWFVATLHLQGLVGDIAGIRWREDVIECARVLMGLVVN